MPVKRGAIRAVLVSKDELHSGKVLRRVGSRTSTLGRSSRDSPKCQYDENGLKNPTAHIDAIRRFKEATAATW